MVNTGSTVPVRLLKDVKTFGRKGKPIYSIFSSDTSLVDAVYQAP